MRSPLPAIDYSSRDWDSIRESIFSYLRKKVPQDWTDFSESNLGVALVEVVAYAFEVLSFSLDSNINEAFLATAKQRESVIKLAGLLGYKLAASTAASVELITPEDDLAKLASPVFVPAGTRIQAGDINFEIDRDYTLVRTTGNLWTTNGGAEVTFGILGAVQGETVTELYTGTGEQYQTFKSSKKNYIDKSVYVTVGGLRWQEVSSLVIGDTNVVTNQNIYEVLLDKDDRITVKFGDGVAGNIVPEGEEVVVTQRVGGGSIGNVAAGAISASVSCTAAGIPAKLKLVNSRSAAGGSDRESIERARMFAPVWGRTTDRAITYNDYVALCNGYSDGENGRVAKAGIIAQPTDGLSNTITMYAWAEDGAGNLGRVPDPLKSRLLAFLNDRKVITVYISPIQDGRNVPVDLDILLSAYQGFDKQALKRQCETTLKTLFASSRVRYDNQLRMSWIHDYLIAIPGIKSINIRQPQPQTIPCLVTEIDSNTLPSQTGAALDQVIVNTPVARVANYYVNYSLVLNYDMNQPSMRRVIASTATAGGKSILTLNEPDSIAVPGIPYTFRHPRRLKITPPVGVTLAEAVNRRLVLHQPVGGVEDVERSITAVDVAENIISVDKDYVSSPRSGTRAIVTPDYFVSQTETITLGSVYLEVEDAF